MRWLLEIVAALLPAPERQALAARRFLDVGRGTVWAGLLGTMGGASAFILGLVESMRAALSASAGTLRDFSEVSAEVAARGSPLFFALSPLGLLLAYTTVTSAVRWLNWGLHGEPLPDPILALLFGARRLARSDERRLRARLGPPRPDRVKEMGGGGLVVLAAAPKPEWNERATIQIGEGQYRLQRREERADGETSVLAYVLEPLPAGAVIRALVHYERSDRPSPRARAADPVAAPRTDAPAKAEEQPVGTRPAAGRWYIDDGEQARLTPEGPTAAVIESLGGLPLRARIEGVPGGHRPTFPGTTVVLGDQRFEVVAEEVLPLGTRYLLEPWPADHILRQVVAYTPRLVRAVQRERAQAVEVERNQRWSWLLYPFVGLLPETRQIMACERLGLQAHMATLSGALFEALALFYGAVALVGPMAGWILGPTLIRAFGALAFGEVGGSLLLGFVFQVAQAVKPFATRLDPSVVPLTREAFWARLALPDRHEVQPDGSILVRSLLPHLDWGATAGTARVAAGGDWWSVTALPPAFEKGRLTWCYQLDPMGDRVLGAPQPPGLRQYQDGVLAEVKREWDDLLFAGSWLVSLMPEEVQERAYGPRGGPAMSRRATLVTAAIEVAIGLWFLRPTPFDLLTAAALLFDGVRRIRRALSGRYGPSIAGSLVSDYLPPERRAYHQHLAAERLARKPATT